MQRMLGVGRFKVNACFVTRRRVVSKRKQAGMPLVGRSRSDVFEMNGPASLRLWLAGYLEFNIESR
jgi:hypothetical protein